MASLTHLASPEQEELQQKRRILLDLEQELAEKECVLSTLKGELHLFERRYHQVVGTKYTELDEVRAQILELATRLYPRSDDFRAGARAAREQADQSSRETAGAEAADKKEFAPSEELKKLFREVAKKIHPDLASDAEESRRRHEWMARLNQAYDQQDEAGIRSVLLDWEAGRPEEPRATVGIQLVRVLRQIQQGRTRLAAILDEVETLKESSLYQLLQKIGAVAGANGDLLEEMAADIESKIIALKSRVRDLAADCE